MSLDANQAVPDNQSAKANRSSTRMPAILIVLLVVGLAYAVLLWFRMGVCAGGADSSGYVNNAKLLMSGHLRAEQRCLEGLPPQQLPGFSYIPLGFIPSDGDTMVPTYALGISGIFAAMGRLMDFDLGMKLSMWLMALGSLVTVYQLARQGGLSPGLGAFCVASMAVCPLFLFMSVQAMSDMPAMLWATLALVLAWGSRRRLWLALPAGVAVALAVFTRPTNALVVIPLAFALGFSLRHWLILGLGGLPGGVAWLLANHELYKKYLATGYGDVGDLFVWRNVPLSLANYGTWIPALLPLFFLALLPVVRLRRQAQPAFVLMCLSWILLCLGFYAFYQYTSETWWYLRFVLPCFPALLVLAVLGLEDLRGLLASGGHRYLAVSVLAAVALGVQLYFSWTKHVFNSGIDEMVYRRACQQVTDTVPSNAVIVAMQMSGALCSNNPNIIVRWDSMDPKAWARVQDSARRAGRPIYAVLFPFETEHVFKDRIPGSWTQTGTLKHVTFWRLDAPPAAGSR